MYSLYQQKLYIMGVSIQDLRNADAALATWQTKDAQTITWILASIEPQIVNNQRSFSTAMNIWDYLKHVYNLVNAANQFL